MTRTDRDWLAEARSDAQDTALNFLDEIVDQLLDGGGVSNDLLNDYPDGDSYHHENHVDRDYDLLDELGDYEETDSGLWKGMRPRQAISCQAAYTYGKAVASLWNDLIKEINDDQDIKDFLAVKEDAEEDGEDVRDILTGLVKAIIERF
jgi:hypothetical protein